MFTIYSKLQSSGFKVLYLATFFFTFGYYNKDTDNTKKIGQELWFFGFCMCTSCIEKKKSIANDKVRLLKK